MICGGPYDTSRQVAPIHMQTEPRCMFEQQLVKEHPLQQWVCSKYFSTFIFTYITKIMIPLYLALSRVYKNKVYKIFVEK